MIAHDKDDGPEEVSSKAADEHHNEYWKVLPELRAAVRKKVLPRDERDAFARAEPVGEASRRQRTRAALRRDAASSFLSMTGLA